MLILVQVVEKRASCASKLVITPNGLPMPKPFSLMGMNSVCCNCQRGIAHSADRSLASAATTVPFVQRWHYGSVPLHSAALAGQATTQLCHFHGCSRASRVTIQREFVTNDTKIA